MFIGSLGRQPIKCVDVKVLSSVEGKGSKVFSCKMLCPVSRIALVSYFEL